MPTFLALQCYKCNMMQVKQEKKSSNKWNCTLCNEKQSVRKVYASSTVAKDVRKFVQDFNFSRNSARDHTLAELAEYMEEGNAGYCYDYGKFGSDFDAVHGSYKVDSLANKQSKWTEYLLSQDNEFPSEVLEDVSGDAQFVTTIPDKCGRKLKRKNQEDTDKGTILPKWTKNSFTAISSRIRKTEIVDLNQNLAVQENTGKPDVESNNKPASKWTAFLDSMPDQNSMKIEDEKPCKWASCVTSNEATLSTAVMAKQVLPTGNTSNSIDKLVKKLPMESSMSTKESIRTLDSGKLMTDHKRSSIEGKNSVSKWAKYMESEESTRTAQEEDDSLFAKWRSVHVKTGGESKGNLNVWALKAASSSEWLDSLIKTEFEDESSFLGFNEEVHPLFS